MGFIIRNISAGPVTVDDLGIELINPGDEANLNQEAGQDIAISEDLPALVSASSIVVLDPLDDSTPLSISDGLQVIANANAPNYRIFGGALTQLNDVDLTGIIDGQALVWSSATMVPSPVVTTVDGSSGAINLDSTYASITQGDMADTAVQPGDNISDLINDVGYLTNIESESINDLSDVTSAPATAGQVLQYNGTNWVNVESSTIGGAGSFQLQWRFSTSTTASDPGNKTFKYNNASAASVSAIYINNTSDSGVDASTLLSSLGVGDKLYIQETSNAASAILFTVVSVIDNTGWHTINVSVDSAAGPVPGNNQVCSVVLLFNVLGVSGINQLTGDVTAGPGDGSQVATIANGVVTNNKLANVTTGTIKGRVTAGTGSPTDLTAAQVRTLLNVADGAAAAQNLWLNITADIGGTATANSLTDTLTLAGGTGISTTRAGDTITIASTAPPAPVDSVFGRTGAVVAQGSDYSAFYATTAQGALADTALQPGDNVSELVNDANYTSAGDNVSVFVNDAGYITASQAGLNQLTGDVTAGPGTGSQVATISNGAVTNAKLANMAANTVKVRNQATTGVPTDLTIGTNTVLGRQGANIVATQVVTAQVTDAAITNAKLADMVQSTIKGRASGAGTGAPTDLTAAQVRTILNVADGATGPQNLFLNVAATTGGTATAASPTDTLTLAAGAGITTTRAGNTITIASTTAPASPLPALQIRRSTELNPLPTTWTDFVFDTVDLQNNTSVIEWDPVNADRVLIKETGLYEITYNGVADDEFDGRIRINDTTVIPGSLKEVGDKADVNQIQTQGTVAVLANLTAGDFLTFQVDTITDAEFMLAGTIMTVKKLQGTKGDKGDQGIPGVGSSILVRDEGVTVPNGPFTTLNFTGAGVTATGSAGTAIINVPGGAPAKQVFNSHNGASTQTIGTTFVTIQPNTIVRADTIYSYSAGVVTVNKTGWFRITVENSYEGQNNRATSTTRIMRSGVEVPGTLAYGYHRNTSDGRNTVATSAVVNMTSGQTLYSQGLINGGTMSTLPQACRLTIQELDNPS
jgi:hypothetical protein